MIANIKDLICLVGKRFDLVIKVFVTLFIFCLFSDYLYESYNINIIDFNSILPQTIQVILQKIEFCFYWLIPFTWCLPICFFGILLLAYTLEVLTQWVDKKGYLGLYSKSLGNIISYCRFISNQSFDLSVLSILGGLCIGGCYYIFAMFNHLGYLINPEMYVSAFENLNPMRDIFSISGGLLDQPHYRWIHVTVEFCKYVIYGLCIYWFYIGFYLSIKRQREILRNKY